MKSIQIPLPMAIMTMLVILSMSMCFFFMEDDASQDQGDVKAENQVLTSQHEVYSHSARFKMIFIVPTSLQLSKSSLFKLAAKATLDSLDTSKPQIVKLWRQRGQMKVALKVSDHEELNKRLDAAKQHGLNCGIVGEAVGYIGIDEVDTINELCGDLKLL